MNIIHTSTTLEYAHTFCKHNAVKVLQNNFSAAVWEVAGWKSTTQFVADVYAADFKEFNHLPWGLCKICRCTDCNAHNIVKIFLLCIVNGNHLNFLNALNFFHTGFYKFTGFKCIACFWMIKYSKFHNNYLLYVYICNYIVATICVYFK